MLQLLLKKEKLYVNLLVHVIPPEDLNENYNEKCDIWSCGVIFYSLLYPPFNGKTNLDIYHNIKNKNPVFQDEEWDSISKDAIDLIKNILNKNSKIFCLKIFTT